ncbi:MAG: site-specific integrase [Candidatus Aminicenantes bacterium]|nr:site-specific integrase [Candidatus Aminicenantes bacterium]
MQIKLFQREDSPFWFVDFWIDGKRFKKSTRCQRKTQAEMEALRIVQEEIGKIRGNSSHTLPDLIESYRSHIRTKNKIWKTKMQQISLLHEFLGDRSLDDITYRECQKFIDELGKKRGIKKSSVNRYIATYKHLFNFAIDIEMAERNPFSKVKKSRETPRYRFFTEAEIERLSAAASEMSREAEEGSTRYYFYYIYLTAIYTGMRLREILNLKWFDIRDDNFVIQMSKSGMKRLVPVHPALKSELLQLKQNTEYIFPLLRRESDSITKLWKKVAEAAKVKDARFHDLRHYFGSMLAGQGVDLVTISEIMGHQDTKTTQIYAHTNALRKNEAIRTIALR